jgi:hypothetical protein
MHHYMEFDPYLIRERNEQIRSGVNSLRLQEQLRKNHKVHGSRLAAFALRRKVTLRLLCRVALAGR